MPSLHLHVRFRSVFLLLGDVLVAGHRGYLELIPNGPTFEKLGWPAVGHVASRPMAPKLQNDARCSNHSHGVLSASVATSCALRRLQLTGVRFPRNPFGEDFEAARFAWTVALCHKDSDGDGRSNGEELGDPGCVWVKGATPSVSDPTQLSHPGIAGRKGALGHRQAQGIQGIVDAPQPARMPKMDTQVRPPAQSLFMYHYMLMPVLIAVAAALATTTPHATRPRWPLILAEAYLISHVGVFLGNHRWASHHAFKPSRALKWLFSFLAVWGIQGSPVHWAFYHRIHHRTCDQPYLDLHSPAASDCF